MESKFAQHKGRQARKAERRENKLCINCGEPDLAINQDGSLSVKCVRCKVQVSHATKFSSAKITAKPRQARDWYDIEELKGWLDTPRFKAYTILVQRAIERLAKRGIASTIGEQKRELGDEFIDRYHCDALDALRGTGSIEEVGIAPLRYTVKDVPVARRYGFDKAPACQSDKTRPADWKLQKTY